MRGKTRASLNQNFNRPHFCLDSQFWQYISIQNINRKLLFLCLRDAFLSETPLGSVEVAAVKISTIIITRGRCHRLLFSPPHMNYSSDSERRQLCNLSLPHTTISASTFPSPPWPLYTLNGNINRCSVCWFTRAVLPEGCSEMFGRRGRK